MTGHLPSRPSPARVAMLSMHTSPLDTPGVGDAGGLNVYVAELAHRLGARGVEVDVFTRRRDADSAEITEVSDGYRVIQVAAGPVAPVAKEELPTLVPEFAAGILDGYGDREWDVLHGHYWLSGMAGMIMAERLRVPLVQTMHTMARVKNSNRADDHLTEPSVREHGEAEIVARAAILTANTPDEGEELSHHYGARDDQLAIVPPGVDLEIFHPCDQIQSRERHGIGQDAKIVLFVGRLQPLKAPDVLIDAVAELIKRRPELRETLKLVIIGSPSGPQSTWADALPEAIRDHGLDEQIIVRPHSPRPELFRWYCVADVVGVPSYNESFGLVALEAQACGRPVVATDVGGLRHAVRDGETGLLVAGHDPSRWADALEELIDDPARSRDLGRNGALHAARFSWDNTAAASLAAYARALH
ncbi:D-inositol-3-phosphate glycosyltransferase [Microlunatus soli]|uniref:D-inositol-3-phosphate glycosyltransferase n=1 Tax=Microlunatus soli TaxID=630515 RepID=A0A1H1Q0C2_9ACTN|nr:D-inositol-3-phosphate glycosyltransferase [Microlunatus soli]SDS16419.1 D-inositol-3-phosphate glycosyltransferase [Microlunatus soli]